MLTDTIRAMTEDVQRDAQVLQVKRRIITILRTLPDDETRRRVIGATAVVLGYADAVEKP